MTGLFIIMNKSASILCHSIIVVVVCVVSDVSFFAIPLKPSPCLNIDTSLSSLQQSHNIFLHRRLKPRHFWPFQNQCDIDIANSAPIILHHVVRVIHEFRRVAPFPPRIRVLKHLADIRKGQGAENSVDDGVINDVSVGMGNKSQLGFVVGVRGDVFAFHVFPLLIFVGDNDTANHDGLTCFFQWCHSVNVKSVSDANGDRFNVVRGFENVIDFRGGCAT
mmetsp:Transcript_61725/g.73237  ORF Transcript_61725/g.73237 Transcript_61725/m.73237 type:complete len:220 (-) Transcript_61725:251-910(-)